MRPFILSLACALAYAPAVAFAQDKEAFDKTIRPILAAHCFSCHSKAIEKAKGNFRLDQLPTDFATGETREAWQLVVKRIKAGEMPPKSKPRMSENETRLLFDWIEASFKTADARRAAEGRVVMRRLNRTEYENTVRDLLGVPVELKEMLPADSSSAGFDNVADALHTSSFLMDKYLEGRRRGSIKRSRTARSRRSSRNAIR